MAAVQPEPWLRALITTNNNIIVASSWLSILFVSMMHGQTNIKFISFI
jgi:hypothetical protein